MLASMKAELSNAPIWMTVTPEILALDGKAARIIDSDGRTRVNLTVTKGDPSGESTDKCFVRAWQSIMTGKPGWNETGGIAPTQQSHNWRGYLNEAAVESLTKGQDEQLEDIIQLDLTESNENPA
jgi:hypothetical protein